MDNTRIHQLTLASFLLIFTIFQSCAPVAVQKYPHHPPYTDHEIAAILLDLKTQEHAVHTFFSTGTITFQGKGSEFEASSLIVGTRKPFKVKIEITHFWGRPLFHIIIKDDKIQILSFPEKLYYVGDIGKSVTSDLLPVRLDTNLLWAMGRGFPILCKFNRAKSDVRNRISLFNEQGKAIQLLDFYSESDLPHRTVLSKQNLEVSFSNYNKNDDIRFAQKTQFFDQKTESMLTLKIKQMVFNKTIDESIFDLGIPSDFKTHQTAPLLDTN